MSSIGDGRLRTFKEDGSNRNSVRALRLEIIAVVVGLLALAATAHAESISRPSLTLGDYWTYRTNTSLEGRLNLEGQVTSRVQARETASVQGTSLQVFRVVVSGSGTAVGEGIPLGSGSAAGTWIVAGEELLETSQLKVVSSVLDLSVNGTLGGLVPFSVRAQNTTTYRVLLDDWRYPLVPRGRGTVELSYDYVQDFYAFGNHSHSDGSGSLTLGYLMDSGLSVNTPAGSFTAYPILETWPDSSYDRAYFSEAVGNDVKTETYNATGVLTSTTLLLSYRYQALEPISFLGLTVIQWAIVLPVVAVATVTGIILWRRSKKKRGLPPPTQEPPARPR